MFVNLPVKDLQGSVDFFTRLGFEFDPRFTDNKGACMVVGGDNFVMLLKRNFFKTFIKKKIANTAKLTESIVALSVESRKEVDEIVGKALASGATSYSEPQDHAWMYQRSFQDLDGHLWEIFYMDMTQMPKMDK